MELSKKASIYYRGNMVQDRETGQVYLLVDYDDSTHVMTVDGFLRKVRQEAMPIAKRLKNSRGQIRECHVGDSPIRIINKKKEKELLNRNK